MHVPPRPLAHWHRLDSMLTLVPRSGLADGFCHAQRTIGNPLHSTELSIPFMRTMHPTLFLPVGLQLAVTVLPAIAPVRLYWSAARAYHGMCLQLISATPFDSQPSRRERYFRDYPIQQRDELPSGWVEQSCFSWVPPLCFRVYDRANCPTHNFRDNPSRRTLTSIALISQNMTVIACVNTCDYYNLVLAGLDVKTQT